jgi:hypothetical protein
MVVVSLWDVGGLDFGFWILDFGFWILDFRFANPWLAQLDWIYAVES